MCVGFVLFFLAPGCLVALAVSSACVAFWYVFGFCGSCGCLFLFYLGYADVE